MYLYTHVCGDACVFVYLRMCEEREREREREREKGEGVLRFRSVKIVRSCPKSQNRQALIGLIERCNFCFLSSFLLQTLTIGRKAGEGRCHLLSLSTTFSRFYHFHHSNTWLQLYIWDGYTVILTAAHVITILLLHEIYPYLGIRNYFYVHSILSCWVYGKRYLNKLLLMSGFDEVANSATWWDLPPYQIALD